MPAPHGKKARPKSFLLRMTEPEDAHVRRKAERLGVAINDVLTDLIAQDMAAEPPPAPEPEPAPKRRRPLRGGGRRADILTPPEDEAIPGQTSVLDDDQ